MDPTEPPRAVRRSAGEWLFQFTTITIGVLIALSFDGLLRWNADRTLVDEARATIALEIADNRAELDAHLASFDERVAKLDNVLKLLGELDAGIEPTVRELSLEVHFPSLNNAGWQTAERTGAIALMQYPEVQQLAELYTLQSLFTDTLQPAFMAANHASAVLSATADPYLMPPAARDAMRARVLELRAYLELGRQLGEQLSDGYKNYQAEPARAK
jgi:hypothetical protein